MERILVWDIPTRLAHWTFAGLVTAALALALTAGEHSPLFAVHKLLGLAAGLVVLLRLVWGLVGTRYARFASFAFGPGALLRYLRGALARTAARQLGHNPGSSYAIYALLLLALGLVTTGWLSSVGSEAAEELHEALGLAMLAVAVAHVVGVAWHIVRHRENIVASMIHGRKLGAPAQAIASPHLLAGLVFLGLSAAWTVGLLRNYDPATAQLRLPLLGQTLRLGRAEAPERERDRRRHHGRGGRHERHRDRDHRGDHAREHER